MKKFLFLFFFYVYFSSLYAFSLVQEMPKFKGDLPKYLQENIKYPESERIANISGKVFVTFVIEKDGSVASVKLLRGVPDGAGLDSEAIRVVRSMPNWTAGTQNNHPVRVQFNLPIDFQLTPAQNTHNILYIILLILLSFFGII